MGKPFDIAVIGGGLAGSVAALACAARNWRVAFVAPAPQRDDRTTALLSESVSLLKSLGVWDAIASQSAPLSTMRILDGTRRFFRAPPAIFRSQEIGIEAFGYNIPNRPLLAALRAKIEAEILVTCFENPLAEAATSDDAVTITLVDGTRLRARAALAADGRKSPTRQAAGIGVRNWDYPQTAIVLNFSHKLPHENSSTEFHTETGPFTQVPLPGLRSSLVWAVAPGEVEEIVGLPRAELNRRVEERMGSILGAVNVEDGMQTYPMSGLIADRFGAGRTMLVGETGHAFPPIGAQGLNLGLRDIVQAVDTLAAAGGPVHADEAARRFDKARRLDVTSRTMGVDMLNRALLSSFLPVQLLRSAGLTALNAIPPLRHFAMREGMTPGWRTKAPSAGEQVGR